MAALYLLGCSPGNEEILLSRSNLLAGKEYQDLFFLACSSDKAEPDGKGKKLMALSSAVNPA